MEYIDYWSATVVGVGILWARLVVGRRAARVPVTAPTTAPARLAARGGRSPLIRC